MTNCMTWNMEDPEPFLEVDVSLKVTLEVMYLHFSFFLFVQNIILVHSSVICSL